MTNIENKNILFMKVDNDIKLYYLTLANSTALNNLIKIIDFI